MPDDCLSGLKELSINSINYGYFLLSESYKTEKGIQNRRIFFDKYNSSMTAFMKRVQESKKYSQYAYYYHNNRVFATLRSLFKEECFYFYFILSNKNMNMV